MPVREDGLPDMSRRQLGAVVAMVGRVPVRVMGDAPDNSFLVPSGGSDGLARGVSSDELLVNSSLRSQCFAVVWKQLPADEDGTRRVLCYTVASPTMPAFGDLPGIFEIAPLIDLENTAPSRIELRDYQQQCYEQAMQQNTLVSLPTGMGKTLIAARLIETYLKQSKGKVLFIVPTRALVEQQAQYCRDHTEPSPVVAELSGNSFDSWSRADWERCVATSSVLLGTPDIFKHALTTYGYISLDSFSLVVFDEVHNATGNSPMATIMRDTYHPQVLARRQCPRIVGLTASFITGALKNVDKKRQDLETLMDANLYSPPALDASQLQEFDLKKVDYLADEIEGLGPLADSKVDELIQSFNALGSPGAVHDAKKVASHAKTVLEQIGMGGFTFYLSDCVAYQLEAKAVEMATREEDQVCQRKAKQLSETLPALRQACRAAATRLAQTGELSKAPYTSGKCQSLLHLVKELFLRHRDNPEYRGIIFVKEVALTFPLAHVLNHQLQQLREAHGLPDTVCADAVSGTGSMSDSERKKALGGFKKGACRVLVCTAALEEGIDVPSCQFIARFSLFDTTKSHIQGSGRARHQDAEIYYFDNVPSTEIERANLLSASAADTSLNLSGGERLRRIQDDTRHIPDVYPFQPLHLNTSVVNLYNCQEIVSRYFTRVIGGSVKLDHYQMFTPAPQASSSSQTLMMLQTMRYPSDLGWVTVSLKRVNEHWGKHDLTEVVDPERTKNWTRQDLERSRFIFFVAIDMHRRGVLGPNNEPDAKMVADAKAIMTEQPDAEAPATPAAGVHLRDTFAPDSLRGSTARPEPPSPTPFQAPPMVPPESMAAATTPGRTPAQPPALPGPGGDFKSQLNHKAMALWKDTTTVKYEQTRSGEQSFISRVRLLPIEHEHPLLEGGVVTGKKAADQLAARAALSWLEENGY